LLLKSKAGNPEQAASTTDSLHFRQVFEITDPLFGNQQWFVSLLH
jgi:hypothetical protein